MQQVIMENEKWLWKNEYDVLETLGAKDDDTQQTKEETSDSNIELTDCKHSSSSAAAFEVTKEQSSCEEAPDDDDVEHNNFLPTTDSIAMEATEQLTTTKSSSSSIPSHDNEDDEEIPNGSNHGLSSQSAHRIRWAHTIPYHIRPAIPAYCSIYSIQHITMGILSLY